MVIVTRSMSRATEIWAPNTVARGKKEARFLRFVFQILFISEMWWMFLSISTYALTSITNDKQRSCVVFVVQVCSKITYVNSPILLFTQQNRPCLDYLT